MAFRSTISIPNTLGIKRLAERARENITVLLSGEGADELFVDTAGTTTCHVDII